MSAGDFGLDIDAGFPCSTWLECDPADFPESPYPGSRAPGSWLLTPDGLLHGLDPVADGWIDRRTGEAVSLAGRHLVLGYGSNLNPVKLAGKYRGERVIVLQAVVNGWATAWCDARRGNGDVVATLVEAPGSTELHAVVVVTESQLDRMDQWEGHPCHYERRQFVGQVHLESGRCCEPEVYLGTERKRPALRVDGHLALCRDVSCEEADAIVGEAR